jgi:formylglycine-generating enzyme required for sulfatase activity
LPTESEWEYAAQGALEPRQKLYSGSNELRNVAYFQDNTTRTRTVGKKKPNELLIFDMSGNVSEWVSDWFGNYTQSSQQNPKGPSAGTHKVVRGGNWQSNEIECRITFRGTCNPNLNTNFIGFRVVRNW